MRTITNSILAGALWLAFSGVAAAQGAAGSQSPAQAAPSASKTLSQASSTQTAAAANSFVSTPLPARGTSNSAQPAQPAAPDQTGQPGEASQPATLGDLARLARAKKSDAAKIARVYDDDNFPRSAGAGDKAPEISIATADGGSVSLGKSSGKVVVLDFWASWCGPCRQSVPDLKRLISTYGDDKLEVISISEDDDEGDMREFVAQNGMTWTQQFDSGGTMGRKYGVNGLPTYVLIGSDGNIIQRYVGASPQISLAERMGPDLRQALEAAR